MRTRTKIVAVVFLLVVAAFVASMFLPSRPPIEDGRPQKCRSNLHQIGLAILLYQNDYGGKYPDDFGQLFLHENGKFPPPVFICEASADTPATGPTTQATADALVAGGHCSYVYLGKGMSDKTDPNAIVAYDPPADENGRMIVLYAGGKSEILDERAAVTLMGRLQHPTTQPVVWP